MDVHNDYIDSPVRFGGSMLLCKWANVAARSGDRHLHCIYCKQAIHVIAPYRLIRFAAQTPSINVTITSFCQRKYMGFLSEAASSSPKVPGVKQNPEVLRQNAFIVILI